MTSNEAVEAISSNIYEKEEDDIEIGSVASVASFQNGDEEERLEDVSLLMTASMRDIYQNMEPVLESRTDFRIAVDTEDAILKNAIRAIKANFDETKVISELRKMYDLYIQSQVDNQNLVNKLDKYLDKIDKYEARHRRDPRVLTALKMAERHRVALRLVDEAKKDLEAEKIEAKLEVKHLEDALKARTRELAKTQDETKKLKDIEKNAELYETQLIRKENELRTLKEKCEADILNMRLTTREEIFREHAGKRELEKDIKETIPEIKRHEFDLVEKRALLKDIEEKTRLLNVLEHDRKAKKVLIDSCRDRGKTQAANISRLIKKNSKLRQQKIAAENEKVKWKLSYDTVKIELANAEEQLKDLKYNNNTLKIKVRQELKDIHNISSTLRDTNIKMSHTSQNLKLCHQTSAAIEKAMKIKSEDLVKSTAQLYTKTNACDHLSKKCNSLQQQKMEQMDLLRMSQAYAMVLAKDVTAMRHDSVKQLKHYQDLMSDRARLRANLFLVKGRYFEAEDRCQVLQSEKEMHKFYSSQLEQQATEMQRKLQDVVQTNIQLYCENTTQEEVAILQNNQYKIKEKEILGLEFASQEQDEVINKLEQTCKEKTHIIEQLSTEVISLNSQVKANKAMIQTMTNEERILKCQLGHLLEQEKAYKAALDLLRRQRDLFGTQLLRVQVERGLVKKQMLVSDLVMRNAYIIHSNLQNDMKLLKLEIRELRRKLKIEDGNTLMIDSLRQEIARLACSLEREKAKNRVLEETRIPIVHRWRAVMASDPSRYEMYVKMSRLTKRLIDKTSEVTEKELIIQKKDFYMMEIQTLLARRAIPMINPKLNEAKAIIRKQTRQLQALQGELNITRYDLNNQSSQIVKHKENLLDANKKITQQQRINHKLVSENKVKLPSICSQIMKSQLPNCLQP